MVDNTSSLNRRDFLKAAALGSAAMAMPALAADNAPVLPRRPFGKHPERLSIIGFGGVVLRGMKDQDHVNRLVAWAYERGVNYFDNAPAYGNAEQLMGPALAPYRKNCFLACKTKARTAEGVRAEMKRSFELLKTDHFDLYQLHAIMQPKQDVEAAFAKGGAMEAILEARKEGKIKYLGFSAHTIEAARAALENFDFDSIMFPINFASFHKANFGPETIKLADSRGMAKLAIKPLCRQEWPKGADRTGGKRWTKMWYEPISDPREAELALKWAYAQGITAAMPPGEEDLFRLAMDVAPRLKPITDQELKEVHALAEKLTPLFRADRAIG